MKSETISTSATLDVETIKLMEFYLDNSGVKVAMMLYKAMAVYKRIGYTFDVYKITNGQVKRFRAYPETIEDVYRFAEKKKVNNNVIWNQIIRDYVICELRR